MSQFTSFLRFHSGSQIHGKIQLQLVAFGRKIQRPFQQPNRASEGASKAVSKRIEESASVPPVRHNFHRVSPWSLAHRSHRVDNKGTILSLRPLSPLFIYRSFVERSRTGGFPPPSKSYDRRSGQDSRSSPDLSKGDLALCLPLSFPLPFPCFSVTLSPCFDADSSRAFCSKRGGERGRREKSCGRYRRRRERERGRKESRNGQQPRLGRARE